MTLPRIEGICLVGSRNQKIYLNARANYNASTGAAAAIRSEILRLEYAAHCSLDVVDERTLTKGANGEVVQNNAAGAYLGLLLAIEDLAIYGMITSTRLRILVLITPGEHKIRDLDVLTILRAIHTCYLSHIGNPFLSISQGSASPQLAFGTANPHIPVKSLQFDKRIRGIAGW